MSSFRRNPAVIVYLALVVMGTGLIYNYRADADNKRAQYEALCHTVADNSTRLRELTSFSARQITPPADADPALRERIVASNAEKAQFILEADRLLPIPACDTPP